MEETKVGGSELGIRWKMTTILEDLDFADDLALISRTIHTDSEEDRPPA